MSDHADHVIVIGAGVAGLATAALLVRDGKRVTVIDQNETVGGRAGYFEADGFRWDTGPSWYLMPEAYDHFFDLCGAPRPQLRDIHPAYRVLSSSEALDVHPGIDHVAALFESIEPGAGDRIRAYLAQASEIYDIALAHFLYTTFSDPRTLLVPDVLSRLGLLARLLSQSLARHAAGSFRDPRLLQILTYPAVFLSSEPAAAPALYALMSHTDLVQGPKYPVGGFNGLVQAIADAASGAEFLLGEPVTEITHSGRRATGVMLAGRHIAADAVVSAADLHHTETALLPPALRTYTSSYFARRDPGLGTVLILLGVRGSLPELAHHTLLFSEDWDPDFRVVYHGPEPTRPLDASHSIYVSKPSASDDTVAPAGHENLFVLVPVPADAALGHGDAYHPQASTRVDAIADAAIEQIASWAHIPDLADRVVSRHTLGPADFMERYNAWHGGAIGPAHTLRQSAFFRGKNVSSKLENLYYAGATTVPGVGVPMCLISAENVLKRMHGDTTATPLSPEFFRR